MSLLIVTATCHFASVIIMAHRAKIRKPKHNSHSLADQPPVTIIRPLRGLEYFIEETLESSFLLDYPNYELIFCVTDSRDPVVSIVEKLVKKYPVKRAILLTGNECISSNPKLNNCVKGWAAALHDWIVFVDSNVLLPKNYIERLQDTWQRDTGVISSPPAGSHPSNFWAHVECAFLNGYQARWQYFADSMGIGFAQGKNLMWHRSTLEGLGGIYALGDASSEDAASTKLVRAAGLRVRLANAPFAQPLGHRVAADVWHRQARWARIRRTSFPRIFTLEILTSAIWPIVACGWLASQTEMPVILTVSIFMLTWYGLEMRLAAIAGWPWQFSYPVHACIRDILLPFIWITGWTRSVHIWRNGQLRL